ncbi:hypothetical protein PCANC_15511 [Puccinia coronata f. sp. avenae]|uniref:Uncharacterized protein n=1 Tax=Puccinia coronata f. sp. avenae TaxID=200324 RepID=A0A2N5SLA8_9BASI|nr:hypothetical protein PCANC_17072 [Puccinia coronata f. sp. avenae]PLW36554.1 hypothetical protein PCANC_15511 [Puccinia coronata f. sp. avenae]
MPLCPNCQKVKLVRCKILRTDDADYGREYVACSGCSSRWFLDDPNRPLGLVSDKPRQSIWKKLATFGSPHNVPDSDGILHAATYVFPPAHEYPSLIVPISNPIRRSPLDPPDAPPDPSPASPAAAGHSDDLDLPPPPPPAEPELDPLPPAEEVVIPERDLEEPPQPADQIETPVEQTAPSEKADEANQAPEQAEEPPVPTSADESSPTPEEPAPPPQPDKAHSVISEPSHQSEEQKSTSNLDSEEQARFERLSRIASSPGPPSHTSLHHPEDEDHHQPSRSQSILGHDYSISLPSKTPSSPISPEEQHLRETLLRVAATPRPPTPKVYASLLSPRTIPQEATCSSSPANEHEVAAYAQRIAARLDEAIQKSPFISHKHTPKTPLVEKWKDSPGLSEPATPASKRSNVHSSHHHSKSNSRVNSPRQSIAHSIPATPRSRLLSEADIRSSSNHSHMSHASSPRQSITQSNSIPATPRSRKLPEASSGACSKCQTPRAPIYDYDEVPLPGGFPTPKPAPLTPEAVSRLPSHRPSPYSTSLKSAATSASLPVAPSHHTGSIAGGRTPKRVSIASDGGRSPLWG